MQIRLHTTYEVGPTLAEKVGTTIFLKIFPALFPVSLKYI